jgi:hypothetical protein
VFKGHKELMLNISRILSKLSSDYQCSLEILKSQEYLSLGDIMVDLSKNHGIAADAFVVRVAFVLGNLTTHYE